MLKRGFYHQVTSHSIKFIQRRNAYITITPSMQLNLMRNSNFKCTMHEQMPLLMDHTTIISSVMCNYRRVIHTNKKKNKQKSRQKQTINVQVQNNLFLFKLQSCRSYSFHFQFRFLFICCCCCFFSMQYRTHFYSQYKYYCTLRSTGCYCYCLLAHPTSSTIISNTRN